MSRNADELARLIQGRAGDAAPAFGLILGAYQLAYAMWPLWWRPVGLITLSYIIQYIGHRIEGNDMGEVVLIKKLLGNPYTAIAPQYQTATNANTTTAAATKES